VQRFRGGLVFKAHRLVHHSTLGLRVTKKKKNEPSKVDLSKVELPKVEGTSNVDPSNVESVKTPRLRAATVPNQARLEAGGLLLLLLYYYQA